MRVHFIGMGGSGMSAIAHVMAASGNTVTGSDQHETSYLAALRAAGMQVVVGHDPQLVDGADAVVVSTAIRDSNVELQRARELGIEVWHRSRGLAHAVAGQRVIAVAGSHGKTTTTAMTAHLLHAGGIDASCVVGAKLMGVDGAVAGGYAGRDPVAVIEADESDGSFLIYPAEVGIITNIEPDHMDHYGSVEALHQAFADFARGLSVLVACVDDPVVADLVGAVGPDTQVLTYGSTDADAVVRGGRLHVDGMTFDWRPSVPGDHHQLNAAAAWLAARALGADPHLAAAAVATFGGTSRRYQRRGECRGIPVIDDYAHHPTEVAAVLKAARGDGAGHLVVLFEPMLFTRTQLHAAAFGRALSVANADIVLAPVHGDREDPIPGVSSDSIAAAVDGGVDTRVHLAASLDEAAIIAADCAREGSTILTLGSGPVTTCAPAILSRLGCGDDD